MFQKQNENIAAVQDVLAQEMTRARKKESSDNQDTSDEGFTSVHHMAVEAVIRKWKGIIKRRKEKELMIDFSPSIITPNDHKYS